MSTDFATTKASPQALSRAQAKVDEFWADPHPFEVVITDEMVVFDLMTGNPVPPEEQIAIIRFRRVQ